MTDPHAASARTDADDLTGDLHGSPITTDTTDASDAPSPASHTRRGFVRGVAIAGASTMAAAALDATGATSLMGDSAVAAGPPTPFSDFRAIAASSADRFEVPEGYRADIVISWDDEFANTDGTTYRYGFNNDFLAFLPIDGKPEEALLFVNHEYPGPFFQHGHTTAATKTAGDIALEKASVGNSIVHVRRDADGLWQVVSPSPYNRRISGDSPACDVTGPLRGAAAAALPDGTLVRVGQSADRPNQIDGSIANCSGGTTPWGTTLSCEENYQDYGPVPAPGGFTYGWGGTYLQTTHANYGWVVEHDPYDPSSTPRKHTALGRFRHENTAFRHVAGKRFVLYMGDDKANEGVYKFVSSRKFVAGRREENLKILTEGQLYVAKWSPEGRRRFKNADGSGLLTATSGTGEWVLVAESELVDTAAHLRKRFGTDYDKYFATNRPEDVEVDVDGTVYVSFTNNSSVNDQHGAVRKLREQNNDPTAATFTWEDYAEGGQTGRDDVGEQGFSSCDNLVFDDSNNLWVVTDISSSSLKGSSSQKAYYAYHGNNAVFMIPRSGPNAGIAYRFANMPIEAEGTGPYFSTDGSTLFVNVQHPGEETGPANATYGQPATYTSWWPDGSKGGGTAPALPRPSTVAITRVQQPDTGGGGTPGGSAPGGSTTIPPTTPPPAGGGGGGTPGPTGRTTVDVPETVRAATLTSKGVTASIRVREASRVEVRLEIALPRAGRSRARTITAVTSRRTVGAGAHEVRLRPGAVARALLRTRRGKTLRARVILEVRPSDGTPKLVRRSDAFRIR
ncbi:PhoX family protein [Patulibacter minatonensis]|uniref:PhoX family protein n=1 Tax=Patulibacter minatonensis TaxID=298163 RepID=UPI000687D962|nr:alkaline phosphatase PhoX [Patulibacter minatonensis]